MLESSSKVNDSASNVVVLPPAVCSVGLCGWPRSVLSRHCVHRARCVCHLLFVGCGALVCLRLLCQQSAGEDARSKHWGWHCSAGSAAGTGCGCSPAAVFTGVSTCVAQRLIRVQTLSTPDGSLEPFLTGCILPLSISLASSQTS